MTLGEEALRKSALIKTAILKKKIHANAIRENHSILRARADFSLI